MPTPVCPTASAARSPARPAARATAGTVLAASPAAFRPPRSSNVAGARLSGSRAISPRVAVLTFGPISGVSVSAAKGANRVRSLIVTSGKSPRVSCNAWVAAINEFMPCASSSRARAAVVSGPI